MQGCTGVRVRLCVRGEEARVGWGFNGHCVVVRQGRRGVFLRAGCERGTQNGQRTDERNSAASRVLQVGSEAVRLIVLKVCGAGEIGGDGAL